jgi:hypothetical protein
MLEHKCDSSKERNSDEADLNKCLEKIKGDFKHGSAVARSNRVRKAANWLPENSVK